MREIAAAAQPITGRGIGYKLFSRGLIKSMSRKDMQSVYRLLKKAREHDLIPWGWIVDEGRQLERDATWDDPDEYTRCVINGYRRDYWNQQSKRVEVWSEKGTVRGVLSPVLDRYAVGFRVMHGFGSATAVHDVAEDYDGRTVVVPYVGDWDPSGLYMSERDLPERLERYGGDHVELRRVALTRDQLTGLPSFPAAHKRKDPRYRWFTRNYPDDQCWELDALDPNDLRDRVDAEIQENIDDEAWERCMVTERASLSTVLRAWKGRADD